MKTRTIYICEKCGAEFETPALAKECEAMHVWPTIIGCKYIKGYNFPAEITVQFPGSDEEHVYKKQGF